MKTLKIAQTLAVAGALVAAAPAAMAGSYKNSLNACKDAIAQDQGEDARVRMSSIDRKGRQYDLFLDVYVPAADGSEERMRAYCAAKGSKVLELVQAEGAWDKQSKREVAASVRERLAQG